MEKNFRYVGRISCLLLFLYFLPVYGTGDSRGEACQEITIPMCRNIGYNLTRMPNQFNHDTQEEAGLEVHQFWPLVEIQCSPDLKSFLCSLYAPMCSSSSGSREYTPMPACRTVCERAFAGCAPLMRAYGFAWPESMRCDVLPEYADPNRPCMEFDTSQELIVGLPPPIGIGENVPENKPTLPPYTSPSVDSSTQTCEEITIPMCRGIGYNLTHMPNQFNHDTQEEADLELDQFWPFVRIQCSPDLRFFLCSLYAPMCSSTSGIIEYVPPCRSVCERAQLRCAPLLAQIGFGWPESLKCHDLPVYGDPSQPCMEYSPREERPFIY